MTNITDLPTEVLTLILDYVPILGCASKELYLLRDAESRRETLILHGEAMAERACALVKELRDVRTSPLPGFVTTHCWNILRALLDRKWVTYHPDRTTTVDDEIIPITPEGSAQQNTERWWLLFGLEDPAWQFSLYAASIYRVRLHNNVHVETGYRYRLVLCYKSLNMFDNVNCRVTIMYRDKIIVYYPFKQLKDTVGEANADSLKGKDFELTLGYFNMERQEGHDPHEMTIVSMEMLCDFFMPVHSHAWYRYWYVERVEPIAATIPDREFIDYEDGDYEDAEMSKDDFQYKVIDKPPVQISGDFRQLYDYLMAKLFVLFNSPVDEMVTTFVNYG